MNLHRSVNSTKNTTLNGISQEKNKNEISMHEYSKTVYSDRKINAK